MSDTLFRFTGKVKSARVPTNNAVLRIEVDEGRDRPTTVDVWTQAGDATLHPEGSEVTVESSRMPYIKTRTNETRTYYDLVVNADRVLGVERVDGLPEKYAPKPEATPEPEAFADEIPF